MNVDTNTDFSFTFLSGFRSKGNKVEFMSLNSMFYLNMYLLYI